MNRRDALRLAGTGTLGAAVTGSATGAALAQGQGHARSGVLVPQDQVHERARAVPAGGGGLGRQQLVWSGDPATPRIALTFDDGPDPAFTPQVLRSLAAVGGRATFFMMGHNARAHPSLAAQVAAEGHEIATHTAEHLPLALQSPAETNDQVEQGLNAVRHLGPIRWFRPPRGELTGSATVAAARLDLDIAMWSVSARVMGLESRAAWTERVAAAIGPGDIVLLHDGIGRGTFYPEYVFAGKIRRRRERETAALDDLLESLRDRGLEFVTVSELVDPA
ncbi:MAG: polysaccharide deacetylase family protein [Microthrixaceae bacterium]